MATSPFKSGRAGIKVEGVPQTIEALRLVGFGKDRSPLITETIKELREIAKRDVVEPTREFYQTAGENIAPLSRWNTKEATGGLLSFSGNKKGMRKGRAGVRTGASRFPAWNTADAAAGVTQTVYFSKNNYPPKIEMRINDANPGGALFEMAGRKTDNLFARNLTTKWGNASRGIWRQWDRHGAYEKVPAAVRKVAAVVEAEVQRKLNNGPKG